MADLSSRIVLEITPEAELIGPDGVSLGRASSVEELQAYCEVAGWSYRLREPLAPATGKEVGS
jgi:hypothetical protein